MLEIPVRATKDLSTVNSASERVEVLIQDVVLRRSISHMDERGEMSEIYSDQWNLDDAPVRYAYMAMVRPGRVKGWVYHKLQADRQAVVTGFVKYVLWDARPQSTTYGMVNEIYMSERNRGILLIPPYVVHAVQNVGQIDAIFVNLPTVPYNHADPDKYRVASESVPYSFDKGLGW
jgi:dTDP-4-dehydrorhamnose 3,5-epimerase